jgi:hypothetical protein
MRRTQFQKRVLALVIAATTLGSCSYSLELRAGVINGQLAFASTDTDYDCIANIFVSTQGSVRAVPATGDDRRLIQNGGVFWWTDNSVIDCKMNFPVFYGTGGGRTAVSAKPLRIGVAYDVQTQGDGAYGHGCFLITSERKVRNISERAC